MEILFSFLSDMMATIRHGGWPELGVWSYVLLAVLVATEGPITTLIGAAAAAAGRHTAAHTARCTPPVSCRRGTKQVR